MFTRIFSGVNCRNCQQPIQGEHLIALGHHYHKVSIELTIRNLMRLTLILGTLHLLHLLKIITKQSGISITFPLLKYNTKRPCSFLPMEMTLNALIAFSQSTPVAVAVKV